MRKDVIDVTEAFGGRNSRRHVWYWQVCSTAIQAFQGGYLARICRSSTDQQRQCQRRGAEHLASKGKVEALSAVMSPDPISKNTFCGFLPALRGHFDKKLRVFFFFFGKCASPGP